MDEARSVAALIIFAPSSKALLTEVTEAHSAAALIIFAPSLEALSLKVAAALTEATEGGVNGGAFGGGVDIFRVVIGCADVESTAALTEACCAAALIIFVPSSEA